MTQYSKWIISILSIHFFFCRLSSFFSYAQTITGALKTSPLEIRHIIPAEYDNLRPPKINGGPAKVYLTIVIMNVRNVDVSEMSIRFDLMMTKRWVDERLKYPGNADEAKVVLNVEWRKNLWMPDVFFENSIDGHVQDTIIPNMYLWLYSNNTIQFTARVSIEFSCHMNLRLFPHDTQECDMIIKSLAHTEDEMSLYWNQDQNVSQGDNIVLPQFEIVKVGCGNCLKPSRFSCLRGTVTMTRRSGYYITNVYVPTSLIVFMSMLTFWIPPDAVPARVTLGVTSLLTIVTKQYQASLPNVSYIVALNVWLSACIGFVFVSLLEYATVIALHTNIKKKAKLKMPDVSAQVRVIHKVYPRENLHPRPGWTTSSPAEEYFLSKYLSKITPDSIDYVSRIVFPCVFISQCSIYWAVYAQ